MRSVTRAVLGDRTYKRGHMRLSWTRCMSSGGGGGGAATVRTWHAMPCTHHTIPFGPTVPYPLAPRRNAMSTPSWGEGGAPPDRRTQFCARLCSPLEGGHYFVDNTQHVHSCNHY